MVSSTNGKTIYRIPFFINEKYEIITFRNSTEFSRFSIRVKTPYSHPNYTSLRCIGSHFQIRVCHALNFCVTANRPGFIFPFHWTFTNHFLIAASRFYPYDPLSGRFAPKRIHVYPTFPNGSQWFDGPSALISRGFVYNMIWHNIVDFTIPLYITLSAFQNNFFNLDFDTNAKKIYAKYPKYGTITTNYHLYLWDQAKSRRGLYYTKYLTSYPIVTVPTDESYCFSDIALGSIKTEKNYSYSDNLLRQYVLDSLGLRGFRDHFVKATFSTSNEESLINLSNPSRQHPIIHIIERRESSKTKIRDLINIDEVLNATKEICPYCDAKIIDLENYDKTTQIKIMANTSLLVGVHGSGLAQMVWMHSSIPSKHNQKSLTTGVIEILPYKYICRDWFRILAEAFHLIYSPLYTKNLSQSVWNPNNNSNYCHSEPDTCRVFKCHDFLRDQSIIVDIEYYKQVLKSYVDKFDEERNN